MADAGRPEPGPAGDAVPGLIQEALQAAAAGDEQRRWDLVCRLHRDGGLPALEAARQLCVSQDAAQRQLGVDILGQLGIAAARAASRGPFRDAAVRQLLDTVRDEREGAVLQAIAVAFGHLGDARCVPPLGALRTHPDADVRCAVAFGLLGLPERAALDLLVSLSADPEPRVRDWATFGLARQSAADFAALRDALVRRLADPDLDTRAEAIHGLATRGDRRAIPPLLEALAGPWPGSDPHLIDEALYALAATTGDQRLCAQITVRRDRWLADEVGGE
ncbi:MAG TPA: HEAT repeat domain-containing protein, partial [Catenuloplanes sp.]